MNTAYLLSPVVAIPKAHRIFQLLFLSFGFFPVTCIACKVLGVIELNESSRFIVYPLAALFFLTGILFFPNVVKIAFRGWLAGLIAVALYDLARIPFILSGWEDFIPKIGAWLTGNNDAPGYIGYLWRYAGNGGGMGLAFFLMINAFQVKTRLIAWGVLYGFFIFSCLMSLLLIFKQSQDMMFNVTPFTFSGSLVGHIIYGISLGIISRRYFPKP